MGAQSGKQKAVEATTSPETIQLERKRSTGSQYGTCANAEDGKIRRSGSTTSKGSGVYIRRRGTTPSTDKPFERQSSYLSSVASGKSLASIRTRLASVSRCDYHTDLRPSLKSGVTVNLAFGTFTIVFGSFFLFGWNIGVLNQPSDLIQDFYNETYRERYGGLSPGVLTFLWSFTNAIFIPGGMIGAYLGGVLADKCGRKRTILASHLFVLAGSALGTACVAAKSPELLMLARFLFGFHSGLGNCLGPMFLSEIAPYNLRGGLGTVSQLFCTLGILLSSVFGIKQILGTPDRWPFLMLLEAVPVLFSLAVLPFLPETPRYSLLIKQERALAEKSLKFYRNSDDVTGDMEEMDTEQQEKKEESYTLRMLLTAQDLRKPLMIAAMLQVIQQFSGINAIFFYSKGIFEKAGVQTNQIPYAVIGTNAVNVAMTIIAVPLMDIAGRRKLMLIPMVVMVADLVLITVALNLRTTLTWMNYVCLACIIIYVICFAVGLGPIPWMIGAELFRQGPRPVAMGVVGVVNWAFTFIITISFESVQTLLTTYTFVVFLVLMVGFTVFVYFLVPETKNKTFEEIAHQFSPGEDIEVEEMMADDDDVFDDVAGSATDMAAEAEDDEDAHLVTINFKSNSVDQPDSPSDKTPLAKGSGNPEPESSTAPKSSTNKDSEQPGEQADDPSSNLETTPMIDDDDKDKKT